MDYQSKYLKYKNKYLELKKIMNQNQIGGSFFNFEDKNKLPSPRQDNEEIEPLKAPRLTYEESKEQQFFPEQPKSQMPARLDLSRQEDRDEQDENDEQDDRLKLNAPRPQFNEKRGEEERVFFREQPTTQMPAPLDLNEQGNTRGPDAPRPKDDNQVFFPETKKSTSPRPTPLDLNGQEDRYGQDDRLKLDAPRQSIEKSRQQAFFPEKKSVSPRPAPKESDKDEKKKPIIKSAFDFLMTPFTETEEDDKDKAPDNFKRKKKN
jgi:hypothetical protein